MRLLRRVLGMGEADVIERQLDLALADLERYTLELQRDAELFPFIDDEEEEFRGR